jgi:hypothetical protein
MTILFAVGRIDEGWTELQIPPLRFASDRDDSKGRGAVVVRVVVGKCLVVVFWVFAAVR